MQDAAHYLKKPIPILYEDEAFIVFDKPSGLLVIPTDKNESNTLVNIVNHQYALNKDWRLHPCHRLDRETSGAIIFAKGKHHQQLMMEEFKHQRIKKFYIAFVQGRLVKNTGELRSAIRDLDQKKFQRNSKAKFAITRYKAIETKSSYSVIEVEPLTGRTNQIRIQFAEIGHPLVGDRKYSIAREYNITFRRTALHAARLEWPHPITHKIITIESDLPKDMEEFLAKHRN